MRTGHSKLNRTFPVIQEETSPIALHIVIQIKVDSFLYSPLLSFLLYPLIFSGTSSRLSLLLNYIPHHTIPQGHTLCRSFEMTT